MHHKHARKEVDVCVWTVSITGSSVQFQVKHSQNAGLYQYAPDYTTHLAIIQLHDSHKKSQNKQHHPMPHAKRTSREHPHQHTTPSPGGTITCQPNSSKLPTKPVRHHNAPSLSFEDTKHHRTLFTASKTDPGEALQT